MVVVVIGGAGCDGDGVTVEAGVGAAAAGVFCADTLLLPSQWQDATKPGSLIDERDTLARELADARTAHDEATSQASIDVRAAPVVCVIVEVSPRISLTSWNLSVLHPMSSSVTRRRSATRRSRSNRERGMPSSLRLTGATAGDATLGPPH